MTPHDEDDDWEDDPPVEVAYQSVVAGEAPSVLADLLLDLTTHTARLAVLLSEADEDEWKGFAHRYHAFLQVVQALPLEPKPRRRVGFKAVARAGRKAKSRRR